MECPDLDFKDILQISKQKIRQIIKKCCNQFCSSNMSNKNAQGEGDCESSPYCVAEIDFVGG
jgi:hypothetical protein